MEGKVSMKFLSAKSEGNTNLATDYTDQPTGRQMNTDERTTGR